MADMNRPFAFIALNITVYLGVFVGDVRQL